VLDFLRGTVEAVDEDSAVIALGGVGVRVEMPARDLSLMDGEVTVHTVLQVKDEDVHLYGFASERGREMFRMLTTVSGVGPKVALAILSYHPVDAVERAISTGDEGALSLVSGVGRKTAARIVLDLKDKLGVVAEAIAVTKSKGTPLGDVREGLKNLGYSAQEIQDALADLPTDGDVPTLMRYALRALGSQSA
jgi:Holliday junction DNA helicase RuvA